MKEVYIKKIILLFSYIELEEGKVKIIIFFVEIL